MQERTQELDALKSKANDRNETETKLIGIIRRPSLTENNNE